MLNLVVLQIYLVFASSQSECRRFGLQKLDLNKDVTSSRWEKEIDNEFCIFQNEFYIIEGERALPTCVGYNVNENASCPGDKIVCCGKNENSESFGDMETQMNCLEKIDENDPFLHPECPRQDHIIFYALPINNKKISKLTTENSAVVAEEPATAKLELPEEQTPIDADKNEFNGYKIIMLLPNINVQAFENPENRILLMHGLQNLISEDVSTMEYLEGEQTDEGGSIFIELNIDLTNELKIETNIMSIVEWLLNQNEAAFQMQNVNTSTTATPIDNSQIIEPVIQEVNSNDQKVKEEEQVLFPNMYLWLLVLVLVTSLFCLSGLAFHMYMNRYAIDEAPPMKSVTSFQKLKEPDMTPYGPSAYDDEIVLENNQQHDFRIHGLNLPKKKKQNEPSELGEGDSDNYQVELGIDSDGSQIGGSGSDYNYLSPKSRSRRKNRPPPLSRFQMRAPSIQDYHNINNPNNSNNNPNENNNNTNNHNSNPHPHHTYSYDYLEARRMYYRDDTPSSGEESSSLPQEVGGREVLSDCSETDRGEKFEDRARKRSSILGSFRFDRSQPKLNEVEGACDYAPTPGDGEAHQHRGSFLLSNSSGRESERGGGRYSYSIGTNPSDIDRQRVYSRGSIKSFEYASDGDLETRLDENLEIVEELVQGLKVSSFPGTTPKPPLSSKKF